MLNLVIHIILIPARIRPFFGTAPLAAPPVEEDKVGIFVKKKEKEEEEEEEWTTTKAGKIRRYLINPVKSQNRSIAKLTQLMSGFLFSMFLLLSNFTFFFSFVR